MVGILGRKLGMARLFDAQGRHVPVTVIEAGPCWVTQVKTRQRDGYPAVQLGFGERKEKHTTKPLQRHFAKANVKPLRWVKEIRDFDGIEALNPGDRVTVDRFAEGDIVKVTGWSKGKGFQGVVKRHHFAGGPKTHGQSDRHRAPGSVGASSYPSRSFKGLRMAGRMGNAQVTVRNLRVVKVDAENHLLFLRGAVPGPRDGLVIVRK